MLKNNSFRFIQKANIVDVLAIVWCVTPQVDILFQILNMIFKNISKSLGENKQQLEETGRVHQQIKR